MRTFCGWFILSAMISAFLFIGLAAGKEIKAVKSIREILNEKIPIQSIELVQNSYIEAADGQVISEIYSKEQNRIYLSEKEIPEIIKEVFITSEDQNFYDHVGFDSAGILRALLVNVKSNEIEQGGSTITQQLARNVYLSHEQSYNRKLSELLYSYQLESQFNKQQILEAYLNAVYFGNGAYGIGTAANYYFSKQLKDLHLAEQVFLSAIPNNPTLYNPLINYKRTKQRQEHLLQLLVKNKLISSAEYDHAVNQKIQLKINERIDKQADYVTLVYYELKQLIAQNEGYSKKMQQAAAADKNKLELKLTKRVNDLLSKGIRIHTALDVPTQNKLNKLLSKHLPMEDIQGAIVVIDHQTHQIKAVSGGKNYEKFSFHRAYQAFRQPGSAIKPLLDYAPYIDQKGATSKSKISAGSYCQSGYCPKNSSGTYYGLVSLETAFKYSYNTPAVRLLDEIGIRKGLSYLKPFGFTRITQDDYYNLAIAIGGFQYGVSPLELTSAFTTFANNGQYVNNRAITKVTDLSGNTLFEWKDKPIQVWKVTTNNEMRNLLSAAVKSGTGQEAFVSAPYIGGKTGTTNDYNDLWFIGLTDKYTAGVWVGKDNGGSVKRISEQKAHLLIWRDLLRDIN